MAEIKNTFLKGKMNKDLDERLVPKGEYRDALNIEVSTSEGSDIGTVQNILGNYRVDDSFSSSEFKCVGSIADEQRNKIFWFVTSKTTDAIIEWNEDLKQSDLIFVDVNKRNAKAALKFPNTTITGINIIDEFLFWTDGISEPKKINVESCRQGTNNISTQTKLVVNNSFILIDSDGENVEDNRFSVTESYITVIKKRPTNPPFTKVNHSETDTEKSIFEKVFPRFCYRYKYVDGEYSSFGPFTNPVFSAKHVEEVNSLNYYDLKQGHNRSMANTIESIELMDFVPSDIPLDVVQVDLLYKREDSTVVYSIASIKTGDDEFNKLGSASGNYFEVETDTVQVAKNKGRYLIKSENVYAAIPENQLLRSWDNVPRKALGQEITGNRLVYGNYTQGYDLGDASLKVKSYYEERNAKDVDQVLEGIQSIKSQREYQIGVVYGDKYGRETPVFTSTEGSIKVPWIDNTNVYGPSFLSPLSLSAAIQTTTPEWADYFKFYIKQTSGEYYNMLMDKVYMPSSSTDFENKEDHVWLAFPSSEINKIKEDDYLILKKVSSSVEKPVEEKNRYKVIDVKAEAPDSVAYVYLNIGEVSNEITPTNLANGEIEDSIFQDSTSRIDAEVSSIDIDKTSLIGNRIPTLRGTGNNAGTNSGVDNTNDVQNIYVSWKRTDGSGFETHSKRYKANSIQIVSTLYRLKLNETISRDDAALAAHDTDNTRLHENLTFTIHRKEKRDRQDFSGKFFVKILADKIIRENLTGLDSNPSTTRFISSRKSMFWWADLLGSNELDGLNSNQFNYLVPQTQPDGLGSVSGATDTVEEWDFLLETYGKRLFIDNMFMTGANLSSTGYAKEAGKGVTGNIVNYGKANWNSEAATDEGLPVWNLNANSTWANADTSNVANWKQNVINGMSGLIESNPSYTSGPFSWKKSIHDQEVDETYGVDDGSFFMHLSFLAPGKNLNDGVFGGDSTLSNVDIAGENGIAELLQGIWGGGAFTTQNAALLQTDEGVETKFIEFEGNYVDTTVQLADAPGPGVGKGYDLNYKEYHERQWDITFSPNRWSFDSSSQIDDNLERFVKNIAVGKKFRFEGDDTEELYTILDVSIKHIYNHTPWRTKFTQTNNIIEIDENSVEYVAAEWAEVKQSGTQDEIDSAGEKLAQKILSFGKASNRRVTYIIRLDKNPNNATFNPTAGGSNNVDIDTSTNMQFIDDKAQALSGLVKDVSALFETEPKDSLDLNIFYESGQAIPTYLTTETVNQFAPPGCRVEIVDVSQSTRGQLTVNENVILTRWEINEFTEEVSFVITHEIAGLNGDEFGFNKQDSNGVEIDYSSARVRFYREDGSYTSCRLGANIDAEGYSNDYRLRFSVSKTIDPNLQMGLSWYNCITFGDGVESDRIRDDFNAMRISNGARASTTIEEPYEEEQRKYGLIYSGLYNAQAGLNSLNQFIQAEKITKDLNPTYGSIQKLFSRSSDLIAFCEDRVIKILANKDALFNADGNPQLVASNRVLGQATPFVGDYGISKNPESFSKESYRAYFTDKQRGAVLRLSMDGLTPISNAGMYDYFRDNLPEAGTILGTYDEYKKQYNVTLREFVYNNIIENSYVNEGEEVSTIVAEAQIIQNPGLESGISYNPVTISSLYEAGGENTPIQNPDILSNVRLVNWPAIGVGDVTQYSQAVTSNVYGELLYNVNADGNVQQTNVGAVTVTVEAADAVNAVLPTFGDGNYMHRAESNQYASASANGYVQGYSILDNVNYSSTYSGNNVQTTSSSNAVANNTGGYTGWNSYNSFIRFPGAPDDGSWNTNQVPLAMLTAYPDAHDLSVFNGEEVWVKIQYRVEFRRGTNGATQENVSTLPNRVNFNMKLIDAATGDASGFRSTPLEYTQNIYDWQPVITNANNPWLSSNGSFVTGQNNNFDTYTTWEESTITVGTTSPVETATYQINGDSISSMINGPEAVNSSTAEYSWFLPGVYTANTGGNYNDDVYAAGSLSIGSSYSTAGQPWIWNTAPQSMLVKFKLFSSALNDDEDDEVYDVTNAVLDNNKIIDQLNVVLSSETTQAAGNKTTMVLEKAAIYKAWKMTTPGLKFSAAINEETVVDAAEYGYFEADAQDAGGTISEYQGSQAAILEVVTTQAEIAAEPAAAIPAWTEVIHTPPANWTTSTPINTTINSLAIETYGASNAGAWISSLSGGVYYSGTTNGVTNYTNAGELIASFGNTNLPPVNEGAKEQFVVDFDDEILIDTNGVNSSYFEQTFDTSLIEGNYYAVDVEYDDAVEITGQPNLNLAYRINGTGTFRIQGCLPLNIATAGNLLTHESGSTFYPSGHYGQVIGTANSQYGDIIFMQRDFVGYGNVQGPVLRAVFKATANSYHGLTKIKIRSYNLTAAKFKSVNIVDVTSPGSGGAFSQYWTTNVTGTLVNALSEPTAYYDNGGWIWDFPSDSPTIDDAFDNTIKYNFTNNELAEQSLQGYSFQFEIDSINSGLVEGNLSITIAQTPDASGNYQLLAIENISTAGTYVVKFNYDGSLPILDVEPENSTATISLSESTNSGSSSVIVARPQVTGFVGKLTLISIIDETTIISGGTSSSWVFSEVDYENNEVNVFTQPSNEILFEEGQIVFSNAAAGLQVSQLIDQVITEGETYNVLFDFNNINAKFEVYYFTSQGAGFKIEATEAMLVDGIFDENLTISADALFNPITDITNSLVVRVLNPLNSISIDNITMTQFVETLFENQTISYSEDVKGWTSFKSFIPENGLSVSKKYFTFDKGMLYQHYYNLINADGTLFEKNYNEFYNEKFDSKITTLLNDSPGIVKTFRTLVYEGSQGYVIGQSGLGDAEIWNQQYKSGWQVPAINPGTDEPGFKTNMDQGSVKEFIEKEEKWFNYIRGTQSNDIDVSLLSFQGLGTLAVDALEVVEEQLVEES